MKLGLGKKGEMMKPFTKDGKPICANCGKPMKLAYDRIAKKKTGFDWRCPCSPGLRLSVGG